MARLGWFIAPRALGDQALVEQTELIERLWKQADAAGETTDTPYLWAVLQLHLGELTTRIDRGVYGYGSASK